MSARKMAPRAQRSAADQHLIDDSLALPPHLRGWDAGDILYAGGMVRAERIIRFVTESAGPDVAPFPIARTTPPARYHDIATGQMRRWKRPGSKPAAVIALPVSVARSA